MKINKDKYRVAVYGSLRKDLSNHKRHLENSKFLGIFDSNPSFTMVSLGGFPGLLENGSTSVKFEVYEVDKKNFNSIRRLEGFNNTNPELGMYREKSIHTPFGESTIYIYNVDNEKKYLERMKNSIVKGGDWKSYLNKI